MSPDPRRDLLEIFLFAVQAVGGRSRVAAWLGAQPPAGPVHLIAVGKAACAMARGALDVLGGNIESALVVTKHGAAEPLPWPVIEAGHPVPDETSLMAGVQLEAFIARLPVTARVLVLLSGGGSALLEQLPQGRGLDDLRELNRWLLGAGLDIHEMNAIRKRFSLVKGGRLAQRLAPREITVLAISDVPGNDPRSIASGPFTPEPSALDETRLPSFVRSLLAGTPPLPIASDPCFARVRYEIIATNEDACRAAADAARVRGYQAVVAGDRLTGDALTAGEALGRHLLASVAAVVTIHGGETTVLLPAQAGRGGRCQSLALAAATLLAGQQGVYLLAAGTDGSDGPTEDAGALVDGGTLARASALGWDVREALARADAGTVLEASGDLVHTGATGTNVMDLVLLLKR